MLYHPQITQEDVIKNISNPYHCFKEAIDSLKNLTTQWNNYELHDTGITLIEGMSALFSDLIIRSNASFWDSLISEDNSSVIYPKHYFKNLSSFSVENLQRLMLNDLQAIDKLFFLPLKKENHFINGWFDVYILPFYNDTAIEKEVIIKYQEYRNLSERINQIQFIKESDVTVDLTIYLNDTFQLEYISEEFGKRLYQFIYKTKQINDYPNFIQMTKGYDINELKTSLLSIKGINNVHLDEITVNNQVIELLNVKTYFPIIKNENIRIQFINSFNDKLLDSFSSIDFSFKKEKKEEFIQRPPLNFNIDKKNIKELLPSVLYDKIVENKAFDVLLQSFQKVYDDQINHLLSLSDYFSYQTSNYWIDTFEETNDQLNFYLSLYNIFLEDRLIEDDFFYQSNQEKQHKILSFKRRVLKDLSQYILDRCRGENIFLGDSNVPLLKQLGSRLGIQSLVSDTFVSTFESERIEIIPHLLPIDTEVSEWVGPSSNNSFPDSCSVIIDEVLLHQLNDRISIYYQQVDQCFQLELEGKVLATVSSEDEAISLGQSFEKKIVNELSSLEGGFLIEHQNLLSLFHEPNFGWYLTDSNAKPIMKSDQYFKIESLNSIKHLIEEHFNSEDNFYVTQDENLNNWICFKIPSSNITFTSLESWKEVRKTYKIKELWVEYFLNYREVKKIDDKVMAYHQINGFEDHLPLDFFDHRLSLIFPAFLPRFQKESFRNKIEGEVSNIKGVHQKIDIYYLSLQEMILLEDLLKKLKTLLKRELIEMLTTSEKVLLNQLKNRLTNLLIQWNLLLQNK
ncbi:hypothetical protein [Flammeovirga pacifica]|uniref:Uncharacterized protein n=1 Tax=Flammeovirga pacifica TaxID=915059 RepID=A0A1S1YXF4_FLAPC|nr:hypothetical protein [Flammeovirga pacifica]OHX65678.1 hypothetical protein NH26_04605 [Flammeovirga pacifica]